jgi:hypothetical protein
MSYIGEVWRETFPNDNDNAKEKFKRRKERAM